jgi:hypothetical protein
MSTSASANSPSSSSSGVVPYRVVSSMKRGVVDEHVQVTAVPAHGRHDHVVQFAE